MPPVPTPTPTRRAIFVHISVRPLCYGFSTEFREGRGRAGAQRCALRSGDVKSVVLPTNDQIKKNQNVNPVIIGLNSELRSGERDSSSSRTTNSCVLREYVSLLTVAVIKGCNETSERRAHDWQGCPSCALQRRE